MRKLLTILTFLLIFGQDSLAQGCSVCTQTTAGLGSDSAIGLNNGILYLAAIPLIFLFIVGFIWYKKNKHTI